MPKNIIEKAKQYFEANLMDGDKMESCGRCKIVIDEDFIEVFEQAILTALEEQKEETINEIDAMICKRMGEVANTLLHERPSGWEELKNIKAKIICQKT